MLYKQVSPETPVKPRDGSVYLPCSGHQLIEGSLCLFAFEASSQNDPNKIMPALFKGW